MSPTAYVPNPVPPCGAVSGVVKPVRLVMSLLAPEDAADRFVRAAEAVVPPVPPLTTATVPVTLAALPGMFPDMSAPEIVAEAVKAAVPLPFT